MLFGSASEPGFLWVGVIFRLFAEQGSALGRVKSRRFPVVGTEVPGLVLFSQLGLVGCVLFPAPSTEACGWSVLTGSWAELGGQQFPQGKMKAQTSVPRRNASGGWFANVIEAHWRMGEYMSE